MQNFPRRIINKTFGNLNIRVYRGKFGYVLAIISEQSVNSFPFLAFIVLDPISEIFEQKEIRFPYNTIRYNFADYDSLCTILPYAKNECFTNFLLLSLSFFSKKTRGQHFNDSVAKKEEKEERGGPLIVFIFTWREIVHQRWHRYQHTSRVFPLGLNERR